MSILTTGVQLTKRGFLINTILFFSFLTWYYVFSIHVPRHIVGSSTDNQLMVNTAFNFIIAITLLLTRSFIHRFNELHVIYECSMLISILTIALLFISTIFLKLAIFLVIGILFSIGQLASFTYFWNLTVPEERGRVGGFIGFLSLPFFYFVHFLIAEPLDFSGIIILSAILSSETLLIKLLSPEKKEILTAKKGEKGYLPEKRTILFYSIPWVVFALINATLARNMSVYFSQQVSSSFYVSLTVLQAIAAVFGALSGGIIADFFGRRLSLAFSLTLYGISSALAGLIMNHAPLHFMYAANGFNWGILSTLYLLVVWGDFANKESCAKNYSIGLITLYSTIGIGFLLDHQIFQIPLVVSSLISCTLIFVSNVPLILAPELLPADFRDKIRLKLYMNVIRKIGRKQSQDQG